MQSIQSIHLTTPMNNSSLRLKPLLCVALVLTAFVVSACALRREGPALGTQAGTKRQGIYETPMDTVVVLDRDLAEWTGRDWSSRSEIAIQKHGARRTETSALETIVEVRNRTDKNLTVELRSTYYDEQQLPLGNPSAWQPLNLPPQGTANYSEKSLQPNAVHYLVEVRRGQRK